MDQLSVSACARETTTSAMGDFASIVAKERDLGVDKASVDSTVLDSTASNEIKASELQLVDAIYYAKDLTPDNIRDTKHGVVIAMRVTYRRLFHHLSRSRSKRLQRLLMGVRSRYQSLIIQRSRGVLFTLK